ncbi:MAG: hypothetical protein K8J31_26260 [Anaerolineae bacterium]|nr:hypothetical protein [Anaerolineae bacterium]
MQLHIVGGFLGSGKTTAIIQAAKYLMAQGQRVGVMTNDQGKYLVDTAFIQLADVPTVEVTGGCFCCNYSSLTKQLDALDAQAHPDIIFAESVGSCADIVATVVRPLFELGSAAVPTSFSVFADSRLLRRWLVGSPLPFSDNINYVFVQQLEEAGLLVINKADLLDGDAQRDTEQRARRRFGDKAILLQNSLDADSIRVWVEHLISGTAPTRSLHLDYRRYGEAEAQLAWLDMRLVLLDMHQARLRQIITDIHSALGDIPIGHFKILVWNARRSAKISFPTVSDPDWEVNLPVLPEGRVEMLLNLRAETDSDALRRLVERVLEGVPVREIHIDSFHPRWPEPTYRLVD